MCGQNWGDTEQLDETIKDVEMMSNICELYFLSDIFSGSGVSRKYIMFPLIAKQL